MQNLHISFFCYCIILMINHPQAQTYFVQYWKQSPLSWKIFLITTLLVFIAFIIFPQYSTLLTNIPELTIYRFEIWRLFFSMFAEIPSIWSFTNIFLAFIWIRNFLKQDDCSTLYRLIQVIFINFEINVIFTLIMLPLANFYFVNITTQILFFLYQSLGWFPIILVYEFRDAAQNPDSPKRFCFLPFTIPSKYFPWAMALVFSLFLGYVFGIIAAVILGVLQQLFLKKMFIRLPFCFYKSIQKCVPNSIMDRSDYVTVGQVAAKLKLLCCGGSRANVQLNQEFPNRKQNKNNKVEGAIQVGQEGVLIGGSNEMNFRNFWLQRQEPMNIEVVSSGQNIHEQDVVYGQVIENKSLTCFKQKRSENVEIIEQEQKRKETNNFVQEYRRRN